VEFTGDVHEAASARHQVQTAHGDSKIKGRKKPKLGAGASLAEAKCYNGVVSVAVGLGERELLAVGGPSDAERQADSASTKFYTLGCFRP